MKQTLLIIAALLLTYTSTPAQVLYNPTADFVRLKTLFADASSSKNVTKQLKMFAIQLDEFLSHVKIVRSSNTKHNMTPYLLCMYDSIPLSTNMILRNGKYVDTIQFQDGKWYITKKLTQDMAVEMLCFDQDVNMDNKSATKILESLQKKYSKPIGDELAGNKTSLFYVKEENLYYAAIESKKIPQFAIVSNNQVLNYASSLKAILQASGVEATYDEIIGQYLKTSIDAQSIEVNDCDKKIAGRRIVSSVIPKEDIRASDIVDELLHERYIIAIDANGRVGFLTAVSMKSEQEFHPTEVRLRVPMSSKEQRIHESWDGFVNEVVALVKIDIY